MSQVTPASWRRRLHERTRTDGCRCWLCKGPARMKLVAWVQRAPLTDAQQAVAVAFWRRFA